MTGWQRYAAAYLVVLMGAAGWVGVAMLFELPPSVGLIGAAVVAAGAMIWAIGD